MSPNRSYCRAIGSVADPRPLLYTRMQSETDQQVGPASPSKSRHSLLSNNLYIRHGNTPNSRQDVIKHADGTVPNRPAKLIQELHLFHHSHVIAALICISAVVICTCFDLNVCEFCSLACKVGSVVGGSPSVREAIANAQSTFQILSQSYTNPPRVQCWYHRFFNSSHLAKDTPCRPRKSDTYCPPLFSSNHL
jgi:hypothetical protein